MKVFLLILAIGLTAVACTPRVSNRGVVTKPCQTEDQGGIASCTCADGTTVYPGGDGCGAPPAACVCVNGDTWP